MRVFTYIDGFNLYHSIKELGTQKSYLKWQHIPKLAQKFISQNDTIEQCKFFTAYPKWKPDSCQRHRVYVEILQDLQVEIIWGHFKIKKVFCDECKTLIKKHEEKQTDVNIATHILHDIYQNKPDVIQIISGDTDLIPPLKIAKSLGVKIHIVIPHKREANEFDTLANKKSKIKQKHLEDCFLGASYTTAGGKIYQCPYQLS